MDLLPSSNPPIGQALTLNAFKGNAGTLPVVNLAANVIEQIAAVLKTVKETPEIVKKAAREEVAKELAKDGPKKG